jgi:hypothetical protein
MEEENDCARDNDITVIDNGIPTIKRVRDVFNNKLFVPTYMQIERDENYDLYMPFPKTDNDGSVSDVNRLLESIKSYRIARNLDSVNDGRNKSVTNINKKFLFEVEGSNFLFIEKFYIFGNASLIFITNGRNYVYTGKTYTINDVTNDEDIVIVNNLRQQVPIENYDESEYKGGAGFVYDHLASREFKSITQQENDGNNKLWITITIVLLIVIFLIISIYVYKKNK